MLWSPGQIIRPMLSDIRDASELEEIADEVLFIYRDAYYNNMTEDKNMAEIHVAKCAHGNRGVARVTYIPEYSLFVDKKQRNITDATERDLK